MNIIGMARSDTSGIVEAFHDENASRQKASLVSAYGSDPRERRSARLSGSSDTVYISEAAMLLASGAALPGAQPVEGDSSEAAQASEPGSASSYSYTGYNSVAQARHMARRARSEAAAASMALLAPRFSSADSSPEEGQTRTTGDSVSGANAAFAIANLQNRLRELQQNLSGIESSNLPEPLKAAQVHSLNSRIGQAMQDISALLQQAQR